jgi:peptidoglycan/xylan/chitin deacetylase (PgdA/CDA1 family)
MTIRRLRWIALPLLLLLAGGAAWRFNEHRTVPISQFVNPIWWYRYARGVDRYDPDQAILYHGNPSFREVAITIDDGPHPQFGMPILAALNKYHVLATFFVVGIKVKQDPQFLRQAVAQGDEIGNHTYDHQRLPALKPHEIANELRFDDMAIYKACGVHPTIMRPPGDEYDDKVSHVLKAMGYVDVCWTDAAKDYLNQTPQFIAERVLDRVEPGSIILLHQDYPGTAVALPVIIQGLQREGYKMVTVSTMLAHLNVQPYADQAKAELMEAKPADKHS